jgi:hypothetical protein
MVTTYSSLGICDEELLEQVPGANIATWNAAAAGNFKAGNYAKVTRLVSRMNTSHGPGLDFVTVVRLASRHVAGMGT